MGLFDDIKKTVTKAVTPSFNFDTITNAAAGDNWLGQAVRGAQSYLGFDKDMNWNIKNNYMFHYMDESVGELTGRNQSRAALNFAKDQYADAQKQAANLLTQQRWDRQQSDIMSSQNAGAATATAALRSGANFSNSTPLGMGSGQQKDFLGL